MHPTAMNNAKSFFDTYSPGFSGISNVKIVEIGAQDVNGSLRQVSPKNFQYIGVDFESANGVDLVLEDPYKLPFDSSSVDIVVSSSCFEHSEMFWLIFLEILRVLKPKGLFYLNAPSAGSFHRYPVDCWRFYPDSGRALVKWAKKNGINSEVIESYIQVSDTWQDFVSIFIKDASYINQFQNRIINSKTDYENGLLYGSDEILNSSAISQNEKKLRAISTIINNKPN